MGREQPWPGFFPGELGALVHHDEVPLCLDVVSRGLAHAAVVALFLLPLLCLLLPLLLLACGDMAGHMGEVFCTEGAGAGSFLTDLHVRLEPSVFFVEVMLLLQVAVRVPDLGERLPAKEAGGSSPVTLAPWHFFFFFCFLEAEEVVGLSVELLFSAPFLSWDCSGSELGVGVRARSSSKEYVG